MKGMVNDLQSSKKEIMSWWAWKFARDRNKWG